MLNLEGINMSSALLGTTSLENQEEQTSSGNFDQLMNVIQGVNDTQVSANNLMSDVVLGKSEDTHGALIALEKASIQMQLMTKVRDELIEGYNKLINIQI